jgi:hypothetical protein
MDNENIVLSDADVQQALTAIEDTKAKKESDRWQSVMRIVVPFVGAVILFALIWFPLKLYTSLMPQSKPGNYRPTPKYTAEELQMVIEFSKTEEYKRAMEEQRRFETDE